MYGVESTENKAHKTYDEFLSLVDVEDGESFQCEPQDVKDNVAVIIYSSGTTGMPKGAEITQWNMFSIISQALGYISFRNLTFKITINKKFLIFRNVKILTLLPSPFSFGSGFMTMFANILKANKTVMLADFDENSYFTCIEVSGIWNFFLLHF